MISWKSFWQNLKNKMTGTKFPICECGKNKWFSIPDSIAFACKSCGRVIVDNLRGGFDPGVSIQEWLDRNMHGKKSP